MRKVILPLMYHFLGDVGIVILILCVWWTLAIYISDPVHVELEEIKQEPVTFLTDKDFSKLYSLKEDINTDTCLNLSQADAWRIMQLAKVEDDTDAISQAKIICVVLNRVESPLFPDTIQEVIEQEGQFSTRKIYKSAEPDINSHLALAMVESGEIKTDCLYFEAKWLDDSWQSKNRKLAEIYGGTKFYK